MLFIVTGGTIDKMPETARYLSSIPDLAKKTVVLTGAMVPYSVGDKSDAVANLKDAISAVQGRAPGVYITMNGQVFDANNVRKDREAGVFRTLTD